MPTPEELKGQCPKCSGPADYVMAHDGQVLVLHVGACGWTTVVRPDDVDWEHRHPTEAEMRAYLTGAQQAMPFEVTEAVWTYFLDVLPPPWMNEKRTLPGGRVQRCDFGFAEGRECVTAFWREWDGPPGDRRVVRWWACRLNELNPNRW